MTSDDHAYNGEIVMKGIRVVSDFECLSCLFRDHARTWMRSNFGVSVSRPVRRHKLPSGCEPPA